MGKAAETEKTSQQDMGIEAVYLMSCALHGCIPAEMDSVDLESLFRYCSQQSITAMVAFALESHWSCWPPESDGVMTPWKQAKEKSIRKNILLNVERQRILAYLDSIGCWYLPMKGSFLQYDYPKFGMRQMSDNDILYDTDYASEVYDFMCGSGYTAKGFGKNNHDEYTKPPVYNFELHRRLFSPLVYKQLSDYYNNVQQRMIKDDDNRCGYHLSEEDFYVYMIAHAYKHFARKGTGIRSLVDVYVFLDKHGTELDWAYVEAEFGKLGITDFERRCRTLSQRLFREPKREILLNEEEMVFLSRFLEDGTYGNHKREVENALGRMEQECSTGGMLMKLRYFWRRMFPPLEWMAVQEPDLLKHPWKLPFSYIRRLVKAMIEKPVRVFREMGYLVKTKRTK